MLMTTQDTDLVERVLARHDTLVSERQMREPLWQEAEKWTDPDMAGGFFSQTPGQQRDAHLFDSTAPMGLETFEATNAGMLCPPGEQWSQVESTDGALNALPAFRAWAAHAADRLHACRNAPFTGYGSQSSLRWRHLGVYGTAALWVDEWVGRGLFYKAVHLSEIYIDEDFRGRPDTVHRQFDLTARQAAQMFAPDQLPPRVRQALVDNKPDTKSCYVHVLRPNNSWEPGRLDAQRFAVQSLYLNVDEKCLVATGGYHTIPLIVSRYDLSPGDQYGRSPAIKVLGTIRQLNVMSKSLMRATHIAVNPPMLTPSDGSFNRMSMSPGKGIPGGMVRGMRQIEPLLTGTNLPAGLEYMTHYQETVKHAFLMHVFQIMNAPIDRQTATEFIGRKREAMLLQAPNSERQMTESLAPQVERELDILMRAGQIAKPPPEFYEAGAGVRFIFDNPITRAAASAKAQNLATFIQAMEPFASIDPTVFDLLKNDRLARNQAVNYGVDPDDLSTPKELADMRQARSVQQGISTLSQAAQPASQAALNLAKARSLAEGGAGA
jgi:hypothetical protein